MDLYLAADHPAAPAALRCYFDFDSWTGRRFESLGLGEDPDPDPDTVTALDIAAVGTLSVNVSAARTIDLLEGALGPQLRGLLARVPADVDLGTATADRHVADGGPADQAWRLLVGEDRIGWVTAGKLLARKRPRLIPVYDGVTACVYGAPTGRFWVWLDRELRADGGRLRDRLLDLHAAVGLPPRVSAIRVLDVVLWMFHHRQHTAGGCGGLRLSAVPDDATCALWRRGTGSR